MLRAKPVPIATAVIACPSTNSYTTDPSRYRSALLMLVSSGPICPHRASGGANLMSPRPLMYSSARNRVGSDRRLLRPRSVSLTTDFFGCWKTRQFSDLMSRWTRSAACISVRTKYDVAEQFQPPDERQLVAVQDQFVEASVRKFEDEIVHWDGHKGACGDSRNQCGVFA